MMMIDSTEKGSQEQKHGKMTFIDLTGSERVTMINFSEYLYEEALFINESLKYLGFIYRSISKGKTYAGLDFNLNLMTSLLSDSIGGRAKSMVITCISPSKYDIESTIDSLKFALQTGVIPNIQGELPVQKIKPSTGFKFFWEESETIMCKKRELFDSRENEAAVIETLTVPDFNKL